MNLGNFTNLAQARKTRGDAIAFYRAQSARAMNMGNMAIRGVQTPGFDKNGCKKTLRERIEAMQMARANLTFLGFKLP